MRNDLISRLAAANPVPHNDPLHLPEPVRARSRRPVLGLAVALVALASAGVAVAAGFGAFEGTPAPHSIEQDFVQLNAGNANLVVMNPQTGAFVTHVPNADASQAHGVFQLQTADGPLDLWAAPELDGSGTCWFVGWESELTADQAIGNGGCALGLSPIAPSTYNEASHPSYTVIVGSVTGSETTLAVTLTDGQTTTLPVAEHLFLGAVPGGSELASIVGRDVNGDVVATWTAPAG